MKQALLIFYQSIIIDKVLRIRLSILFNFIEAFIILMRFGVELIITL